MHPLARVAHHQIVMRFTLQDYQTAIESLRLGITQLEPDGNECAICGDGGHQAMECGRNPLLAQECCVTIAKQSEALHETLHALAGYNTCMGQTTGPAAIIAHNDQGDSQSPAKNL